MSLDLPVVSSTLGPEWASLLNAAQELIDAHDHTAGKGVKVTPAGLLMNAILDMAGYGIGDANAFQMRSRGSADTSSDALGSIQAISNNLYFVNSAGDSIQLTDGSTIFNPGGRILSKVATTSYNFVQSDRGKILMCDTSGSAYTLTLPAAAAGQLYCWAKDIGSNASVNNITINTTGGETIDGASSQVINSDDGILGFFSDYSSNWYVM